MAVAMRFVVRAGLVVLYQRWTMSLSDLKLNNSLSKLEALDSKSGIFANIAY